MCGRTRKGFSARTEALHQKFLAMEKHPNIINFKEIAGSFHGLFAKDLLCMCI